MVQIKKQRRQTHGLSLMCALIVAATQAWAATETVLYNFEAPPKGANPYGGLIHGSDGYFYGTASSGGALGAGIVYKLSPAGRQTILYNFTGGADGGNPQAGVIRDSSGNLYGTATTGGSSAVGVVFKLNPAGDETVLYNFTPGPDFFGGPSSGVTLDTAGNLYGTAIGGLSNAGFVYKLDTGGTESALYSFTGGADGGNPSGGVILDSSGNLYGTAVSGGASGAGIVFKLSPTGGEKVLFNFTGGVDGGNPNAGLIRDGSGDLFGTTPNGGASGWGAVFKLDINRHETVLYNFTGGVDGGWPYSGVIRGSDGNFYGTTAKGGTSTSQCAGGFGCGVIFELDAAGHETVLYNFADGPYIAPYASGVFRDSAGDLYGTTHDGGPSGQGVVYKVDTTGQQTILFDFPIKDGFYPTAGVIRSASGVVRGTTFYGGPSNAGTVFLVTASGQEKVLYSFTGGADGSHPQGGVIEDAAGNLYGTTVGGGAAGQGVVFKLDPSGDETVLYSFTGGPDGAAPQAGLVMDSAGNLYGTTFFGGAFQVGAVFKVDTSGHETLLHSFSGADGGNPAAGVVGDSAGNLYGTTADGGPLGGGEVYKLSAAGKVTILLSFPSFVAGFGQSTGVIRDSAGNLYGTDTVHGTVFKISKSGTVTTLATLTGVGFGASGLVRDSEGNLYGTSSAGGEGPCSSSGGSGCGVVFKVDSSGNQTMLYTFTGGADGGTPQAGVILDSAGNLYGTTYSGGSRNRGVVFQIQP